MGKVLSSVTVCMLVVLTLFTSIDISYELVPTTRGATIYVGGSNPGNCSTIQEAVSAAIPGDTIFVYSGDYNGTVNIQKPLTIIGEDRETTRIIGGDPANEYPSIDIWGTNNVTIMNIYIFSGVYGVLITDSNNINFLHCKWYGANLPMINSYGSSNILVNDTIFEKEGTSNDIYASDTDNFIIKNSIFRDWYYYHRWGQEVLTGMFFIRGDSHVISLNTFFAKGEAYVHNDGTPSNLTVQWYLTVNVENTVGDPVEGATVLIFDSFGTKVNTSVTDLEGKVRNMIVIEYIQDSSKKTYYTPHNVTAVKGSEIGYAVPEPKIDISKEVTVTLIHQNYFRFLEQGWNLISFNRLQPDTTLKTVLQSIDGKYDSLQWFNSHDSKDPWKHYHNSKPSNMNDLKNLDHTMGFWIHITAPGGTTFVLNGTLPSTPQYIPIHQGWNLVGYPSLSNKNRTNALNNLTFDTHVDAIWTFDAEYQKWMEIKDKDYFEVGRGYWIHAKTDCVWEVPL